MKVDPNYHQEGKATLFRANHADIYHRLQNVRKYCLSPSSIGPDSIQIRNHSFERSEGLSAPILRPMDYLARKLAAGLHAVNQAVGRLSAGSQQCHATGGEVAEATLISMLKHAKEEFNLTPSCEVSGCLG